MRAIHHHNEFVFKTGDFFIRTKSLHLPLHSHTASNVIHLPYPIHWLSALRCSVTLPFFAYPFISLRKRVYASSSTSSRYEWNFQKKHIYYVPPDQGF